MSATTYTLTETAGAYTFAPVSSPPSPPTTETRQVYVTGVTDASLAALLPTLKAASYNTVKLPGQSTQSLAGLKAQGMRGWVTLGVWQQGGGWDQTTAQMIATAQAAVTALGVANVVFYLADEPAQGNTTYAQQILAFSSQLKAAVPGARTMIAYYDQATVHIYKGLDLIAADIYPNKFGWNFDLCTQLGEACAAASLPFTGICAIASDTLPLPTVPELDENIAAWTDAGSQGFGVYCWGLGAEQSEYVAAVKAA